MNTDFRAAFTGCFVVGMATVTRGGRMNDFIAALTGGFVVCSETALNRMDKPILPFMVQLVRMDFYRNGVLNVVHLPRDEAIREHRQRTREGWVLAYSVLT